MRTNSADSEIVRETFDNAEKVLNPVSFPKLQQFADGDGSQDETVPNPIGANDLNFFFHQADELRTIRLTGGIEDNAAVDVGKVMSEI